MTAGAPLNLREGYAGSPQLFRYSEHQKYFGTGITKTSYHSTSQ
jgi:hypothetical protein